MECDVRTITALPGHRLQVELLDGRIGIFDVTPYLEMPALAALRDPAYFKQVGILFGAATWPGGEDIAPATLALELQAMQTA